jgi:hypothetical protein
MISPFESQLYADRNFYEQRRRRKYYHMLKHRSALQAAIIQSIKSVTLTTFFIQRTRVNISVTTPVSFPFSNMVHFWVI